jgi:hypothetical protein|tara:strand:- start:230 stop:475 length:246 start_codon:yes stop_codon:yes gene_type:complete
MNFKIEDGIPLPASRGRPPKYDLPLHEMQVNQSITIALPKTKIYQEKKIISNYVLRYTHKNPSKKFSVRMIDDGVGVWRIA